MSDSAATSLRWSAQLSLSPPTPISPILPGDKVLLPPSALEQLLSASTIDTNVDISLVLTSGPSTSTFDPFNPNTFAAERQARAAQSQYSLRPARQQPLPHPLTFRLVNSQNNHVVYAGVREFSAEDGEIVLSPFLHHSLGLDNGETLDKGAVPCVTIHVATIPKGTYVRFRPLEAGYDPEDWKVLLEQHLRSNYTTLTCGEILIIPFNGGSQTEQEFRFLIDKIEPDGDAICVVDTDLQVDIEALNEEQARETLKKRLAKQEVAAGTREGSSTGGELKPDESESGQVLVGQYVDYRLLTWDREHALEVVLEADNEDDEIDIFISPFSSRQRSKPREDEFIFADMTSHYPKRLVLDPSDSRLEDCENILVSIHGYQSSSNPQSTRPLHYRISASRPSPTSTSTASPVDPLCPNCNLPIPPATLPLHTAFCARHNISCPLCHDVFLRKSPTWQNHWHCHVCPDDPNAYGSTPGSHQKHNILYHPTTPLPCPSCPFTASSIPALAIHRTSLCPAKPILCSFCHLSVPQQSRPYSPSHPTLEVEESLLLYSGLTPHEVADGGRTTDCPSCSRPIRLRDLNIHLRHHDLENASRPTPPLCRNNLCGRSAINLTISTPVSTSSNDAPQPPPQAPASITQKQHDDLNSRLGLCTICYAPLYAPVYDPDGKAMRRRIERRYLSQMTKGCGRSWCRNRWCKIGRVNMEMEPLGGAKEVSVAVKPLLALMVPRGNGNGDGDGAGDGFWFCVDEAGQQRRATAEIVAIGDGVESWEVGWWVAALEILAGPEGDTEKAGGWLEKWAPKRKVGRA